MSLTNQKIRIATPAISRAIQEDLFKQGYTWRLAGNTPAHVHADFLYASEDGFLTFGEDDTNFDNKSYPEMIYTTESKLSVVSKKPTRTKIVLFGKTYFKDELDAALATLRTAQ